VHLAVSGDGLRLVMFQGHPEYDTVSLLKEYKREVYRYAAGARPDYPPFPDNIFSRKAAAVLTEYRHMLEHERDRGRPPPAVPEARIAGALDNTWRDTDPRDPQRPCRLYTVFRPETADELAQMQSTAHKLHERYPNLRVVLLASAQNEGGLRAAWDREYERLRGFCTLLPLRRGADTPS